MLPFGPSLPRRPCKLHTGSANAVFRCPILSPILILPRELGLQPNIEQAIGNFVWAKIGQEAADRPSAAPHRYLIDRSGTRIAAAISCDSDRRGLASSLHLWLPITF